jgi:hypothetical protein
MTSNSNTDSNPRVWTDTELKAEAQLALDEFVDRRLREPGGKYIEHLKARRKGVTRLFGTLRNIDAISPDPNIVRTILRDGELFDALRYVAGPPVSEDDLGVLVTRKVTGLRRSDWDRDDDLTAGVLKLICKLADPWRFPWIVGSRIPTAREIRSAIESTTTLHAAQSLQTERRGHGRRVEQRLEERLVELGFTKISGQTAKGGVTPYPRSGKITQPSHHPVWPNFFGECTVYGRKVDLFIALATGRMIALEAKDSSSALNSTKRLLNDTAAKARHYQEQAGKNVISVALLSGVFKLQDLRKAQTAGLYLVWAHNMDDFIGWIESQS